MTPHLTAGNHDEQPSDGTTLVDVVDGYSEAGFTSNFWADADACVRCDTCQHVIPARTFQIHSMRRLEGASDPADMTVVVATECPTCGAQGTMVLGYGPVASDVDADVLSAMGDHREASDLPPDSPPNETPDER